MGNTCASVHIAWTGMVEDAAKAITRSYRKLGYERVKKAPAKGGKHAVLLARAGQSYVSVYDSDNAELDSGELKDLALAASKSAQNGSCLWFGSQPVSFERINSIAILAAARIPLQLEFLVGTRSRRRVRPIRRAFSPCEVKTVRFSARMRSERRSPNHRLSKETESLISIDRV